MTDFCQACEIDPPDIIEPCDDETSPYHVCSACHDRLHARALRPVEWYNLAKRHGWWQFLLHDPPTLRNEWFPRPVPQTTDCPGVFDQPIHSE